MCSEQTQNNTTFVDHIDTDLQDDDQTGRTRQKASNKYLVSFKDGKYSQKKNVDTSHRYNLVASQHEVKVDVSILEPCCVNPNSLINIQQVLCHLKTLARQWLCVVCDGQPYSLICKLMAKDPQSFGWLLLRPGGGHIEINMFRSFSDIYFDVFLRDIARLLGFQTQKALNYCKRANDHHKSWDILNIAMEGTAAEMVLTYVREAINENQVPTAHGFKDYFLSMSQNNMNNMKMKVLYDAVMRYLLAIVLFDMVCGEIII